MTEFLSPNAFEVRRDLVGYDPNQVVIETGTATDGTDTELIDSTKTWPINKWSGAVVEITAGTGSGQSVAIISNSETALTVEAWDTNPDDTSVYSITIDSPGLNIAYLRFDVSDPTINQLLVSTQLIAEPFDYQTARLRIGLGEDLNTRFLSDIASGFTPAVSLVRSSYGFPATPEDGETVWFSEYNSDVFFTTTDVTGTVIPTAGALKLRQVIARLYDHSRDVPDFPRELTHDPDPAIYDRALMSGRWYYYTLFLYVTYPDPASGLTQQHWIEGTKAQVLIPNDYKHRQHLFNFLPPYYQSLDNEYVAGTAEGIGRLQQLFNTIGFELDYVRTLSEGIENAYNIDQVNQALVQFMGTSNMGVTLEHALGDARYRSLVSSINWLYAERGSARSVQQLTSIASKYPTEVSQGVNLLRLSDDSQFYGGTGSWGSPPADLLTATGGLGGVTAPATLSLVPTTVDITETSSKRSSVCVVSASGSTSGKNGLVMTCGYGTGLVEDRHHHTVSKDFVPYYHGVRCTPGLRYTFSFYVQADVDSAGDGDVAAGIMWFYAPLDTLASLKALNLSLADWISPRREAITAMPATSTVLQKYSVETTAPETSPLRMNFVYAVPYIAFTGVLGKRRVSSAMLNQRSGISFELVPLTNNYLTLAAQGTSSEFIGLPDFVMGDVV